MGRTVTEGAVSDPGGGGRARRDAVLLAVAAVPVVAAAAAGAAAARGGDDGLYERLDLPAWLFSPVWTVLYVLLAVALWLVVREGLGRREVRVAAGIFVAHLVFQAAWTPIFFGAEAFGWVLVDIVAALATAVVAAVAMGRVRPLAGWSMVVYLGWLAYATALNTAVVALN